MGGGGGFFPSGLKSDEIKKEVDKSLYKTANKTNRAEFDSKVGEIIDNFLIHYNDRKTEDIEERLEQIRKSIEKEIEDTIKINYGGSISKHTYVDGLSDIDALVILNNTELADKMPEKVQDFFMAILNKKLKDGVKIEKGTLAVTVRYKDGMEIQLLPALKIGDSVKIPSSTGKEWSKIEPKGFTKHLTDINQKLGGKVVPTIKIIKSINDQFPEKRKMTGYHIESLAIEAFKSYSGEKTVKSLLIHFFDSAKEIVKAPIKDKTKQSIHVDDYLGVKNSDDRKAISYQIDVISRKLRSAEETASLSLWKEILGEI